MWAKMAIIIPLAQNILLVLRQGEVKKHGESKWEQEQQQPRDFRC